MERDPRLASVNYAAEADKKNLPPRKEKNRMAFDYDGAEEDLHDMGLDSAHLSAMKPADRDKYLRSAGLDPKRYGSTYKPEAPRKSSSIFDEPGDDNTAGCFLTSACVKSRGLSDDCKELTVLRAYRDGYLSSLPEGKSEVKHYYKCAPGIVKRIDSLPDAKARWDEIYRDLIARCVDLIEQSDLDAAHQIYRDYVLKLEREFPE